MPHLTQLRQQWAPERPFTVSSLAVVLWLPLFPSCISVDSSSAPMSSSSIVKTQNYIDTISDYADLSSRAEDVLSTAVRGEQCGCHIRSVLQAWGAGWDEIRYDHQERLTRDARARQQVAAAAAGHRAIRTIFMPQRWWLIYPRGKLPLSRYLGFLGQ